MATKADHEIKIKFMGEPASPKDGSASPRAASASPKVKYTAANAKYAAPATPIEKLKMHVKQTVRYTCDSDDVEEIRIVFPECSPFRDDHEKGTEVLGNEILTLMTPGDLESHCYLKLKDGRVLGWSDEYPDAGGDHRVQRP